LSRFVTFSPHWVQMVADLQLQPQCLTMLDTVLVLLLPTHDDSPFIFSP
jgi:hypothetical protein